MAVFVSQLNGRFGDRIITHLNLRQMASLLETTWFAPLWPPAAGLFNDEGRIVSSYASSKPYVNLSAHDIRAHGPRAKEFLNEVHQTYDIHLIWPFLGRMFYLVWNVECNRFLETSFKEKICTEPGSIVVHMRGGDFLQSEQRRKGVFPLEFYMGAINICREDASSAGKDPHVIVCTDDMNHPTLTSLTGWLNDESIPFSMGPDSDGRGLAIELDSVNTFMRDWLTMINADYHIAVPSTFSLSAGMLGNAKIIHNIEWVKWRNSEDDGFWVDLYAGGNSQYSCWKMIDEKGDCFHDT